MDTKKKNERENVPRIIPVAKACSVVVGATAARQNKREDDDADDNNDFEAGQPKFKFAEPFDAHEIDQDNSDQDDGNPDTRIDSLTGEPE